MKKTTYLNYLIKENTRILIVFLIVTILLFLIVILLPDYLDCWYVRLIEPIFVVGTTIIAICIWFFQAQNNWKESLDKRLTVHFMYQNKAVMSCYEAYLSGVSDIRQWAQQIGRQMNDGANLDFDPYIEAKSLSLQKSALEQDEHGDLKDIMLYEVTFHLRNLQKEELKNQYLIWINDINNKKFLKVRLEEQFDIPFTAEKAIKEYKKQTKPKTEK